MDYRLVQGSNFLTGNGPATALQRVGGGTGAGGGLATPRALAEAGQGYAKAAVGSASSGVKAVQAEEAQVRSAQSKMREQAQLVNTQGNALNTTAGQIKDYAGKMTPYADQLGGIGDTLLGEGSALWDQSKDIFGQGGALARLDGSAGGLAGEFVRQYNLLSPDRYVSQAASDVQGSYQNAWDQMVRGNARRGVSAGSGAAGALGTQYAAMLATARAAAKTKARQMGIDEQTKMLSTMTGAANTLYNMGNDTAQSALAAQKAGADAKKGAADVLGGAADALGKAGSLQSAAGQLFANAADIFGNAARIGIDYANTVRTAYDSLSGAQQAAADYYLRNAKLAMGSGGGTNVTNVTTAPKDTGWKNTGYSSTYVRNTDPELWKRLMLRTGQA